MWMSSEKPSRSGKGIYVPQPQAGQTEPILVFVNDHPEDANKGQAYYIVKLQPPHACVVDGGILTGMV